MTLGVCSRSKDIVEPIARPQWFVKTQGMAQRAYDAVRNKELHILPASHEATWFSWLGEGNIQDWCISRQLWWGHRIPAYQVRFAGEEEELDDDAHWFTGRSEDEAKSKAEAHEVVRWAHEQAKADLGAMKPVRGPRRVVEVIQDHCVLDTWFSSALLPFSAMGWPDDDGVAANTSNLARYFPGSLLETGHDILFFWVARMVMLSLELTDQLPFKTVYLHAMVRDESGAKMAKSRGNVIDPLDVMDGCTLEALHDTLRNGNLAPLELEAAIAQQKKIFPNGLPRCGSDALRFGLLAYTQQERDIALDINRVAASRQFCNKLWNATRFALRHLEGVPHKLEDCKAHSLATLWIGQRLYATIVAVDEAFRTYQFARATTALYNFWLHDLCDVFLELIKTVLQSDNVKDEAVKQTTKATLYLCLDVGLRLLHPMMPFVTEELYHRLPGHKDDPTRSIMVAAYPESCTFAHLKRSDVESQMELAKEISHAARSTRASLGLTSSQRPTIYLACSDPAMSEQVRVIARDVAIMSFAETFVVLDAEQAPPAGAISCIVSATMELFIPLTGLVEIGPEIRKLEKNQTELSAKVDKLQQMIRSEFYHKVPRDTQLKNAAQLECDQAELDKTLRVTGELKALLSPDQMREYLTTKLAALETTCETLRKEMSEIRIKPDAVARSRRSIQKLVDLELQLGRAMHAAAAAAAAHQLQL